METERQGFAAISHARDGPNGRFCGHISDHPFSPRASIGRMSFPVLWSNTNTVVDKSAPEEGGSPDLDHKYGDRGDCQVVTRIDDISENVASQTRSFLLDYVIGSHSCYTKAGLGIELSANADR